MADDRMRPAFGQGYGYSYFHVRPLGVYQLRWHGQVISESTCPVEIEHEAIKHYTWQRAGVPERHTGKLRRNLALAKRHLPKR